MAETIRMTTAQAIVKFLDNQYVSVDGKETKFVEGFFTIFGHGIAVGLGEALDSEPGGLRVMQGRNEQGMCHAAIAFAKQNQRRKIIACSSSVGRGAANMVTACATATVNNIPLLVFPQLQRLCWVVPIRLGMVSLTFRRKQPRADAGADGCLVTFREEDNLLLVSQFFPKTVDSQPVVTAKALTFHLPLAKLRALQPSLQAGGLPSFDPPTELYLTYPPRCPMPQHDLCA